MTQDLNWAARALCRAPGMSLAVILTIALGSGASTAVFSVVDRILFRSLPYPDATRLVSVGMAAPIEPVEFMLDGDYVEWRRERLPFSAITSWSGASGCDLTEGEPVRLSCAAVEANFLATLGMNVSRGRDFSAEEDLPNGPRVALLSDALWRSRFGGAESAVGRLVSIDGQPVRVIGVLPREFELPTLERADLLTPQRLDAATAEQRRSVRLLRSYARLEDGVTIAQAQQQLMPLFERSMQYVPAAFRKEVFLRVRPLRDLQVRDARVASWVLFASVLCVLAIACVNVANLLLARATARSKDTAIREALGASPMRLLRQGLLEALLLTLAGGAAGCALAWAMLRVFVALSPQGILRLEQATIDVRVLTFALSTSALGGALAGLYASLIKRGRGRLKQALVAAQVAASVVLLFAAGILLRGLWRLESMPPGFRAESVITASMSLGAQRYPKPEQQAAFLNDLEERLARLPGVERFTVSDTLPPVGDRRTMIYAAIDVRGREPSREGTGGMVTWRVVSPGYFETLGIPIVEGRGFAEEDRREDTNTIILNQTLAARMFPGRSPLGELLRPGRAGAWMTVVGVAGPSPEPEYYVVRKRTLTSPLRRVAAAVRSRLSPELMARTLRATVAETDPLLPVSIATMESRVKQVAARPRFNAILLGLFAFIGVTLAAIGLYGVIDFQVRRRTREFGVRMALGATPSRVARDATSRALMWVAAGIAAGVPLALFSERWLRALLSGIEPGGALPLLVSCSLLAVIAVIAALAPARRAARIDPAAALRVD